MLSFLNLYKASYSNLQRNVWILAIAMFINRSGSMVLLFTSLYMTNELGFSIAQTGFVMSFYGIGSVLGSYSGGWLTDRKNFFDIMIFSLISSGCILLLLLYFKSPFAIACIIFIYAFAADIFRPANSAAIAVYSTLENRTRSVSLVRMAINLGFSLGPAIGGFVAIKLGFSWLFVIDAMTGFLAAIMLYKYLPRVEVEKGRGQSKVLLDSSTSAYRDYKYLFFIFLVAIYGICFFQIFASIPQYFSKVCHYHEDRIGLLLALNGFLVVLIEMPLVAYLENKPNTFKYIIIGVFFLPTSFVILLLGQNLLFWALVYTLTMTLSEIFAMPFMMNFALSRPLKERQGQYAALYSIAYGIANIAAPSLGLGIAGKYGFENMFYFLIVFSCFNFLGFWYLKKSHG